jgi:hypothetical protein
MKRWLGMSLLFSFLLSLSAFSYDEIAIVKHTEGTVTLKRNTTILPLKERDQLLKNDIVITGEKSSVGVIFHDGSVLSLGEKSHLVIEEFVFKPLEKQFKFDLYMNKGTALFESGKIGTLAPEAFEFKIPEGTVGIRGTKFIVEVK